MKVLFASLLIGMAGCQFKPIPPVAVKEIAKKPCEPSVTEQSHIVRPTVAAVITENSNWSDTHKVSCPENMRTVVPSTRELIAAHDADDSLRWLYEHEYCIPDGGKP